LAQKDIEDLPIEDVVPTPVPAKTVVPKLAPTVKTQPTATPKVTSKVTPKPTAMPKPAATPATMATVAATPKADIENQPIEDKVPAAIEQPTATNPLPVATATPTSQPKNTAPASPAQSTESQAMAPAETENPTTDEQSVAWFDLAHTFQINFIRHALFAGVLVALMCSYLGIYVVLKRIVFVGVALAELSSAGIAVGLWLGFSPIIGAMLLVLLGVTMFAVRWSPRRVPSESVIGIVYSVAGALAILCIAKSAMGETHMLKLLQGDVLTVAPQETLEMLGIFAVVALIHALFGKEFLLVSFDRDAASTMGYSATRWDFLLYLTIGIVISFSIRATGVLMATTMLIIPAVSALLLAQRMRQVWLLALLFGVVPVFFGLHLSFLMDLPASAVIVALSFLFLLPVLAFSSRRS
jgi:ABC-type Mn2+/Zn2+ transport system permease subunit